MFRGPWKGRNGPKTGKLWQLHRKSELTAISVTITPKVETMIGLMRRWVPFWVALAVMCCVPAAADWPGEFTTPTAQCHHSFKGFADGCEYSEDGLGKHVLPSEGALRAEAQRRLRAFHLAASATPRYRRLQQLASGYEKASSCLSHMSAGSVVVQCVAMC